VADMQALTRGVGEHVLNEHLVRRYSAAVGGGQRDSTSYCSHLGWPQRL
jgi:hypothetical protein